MIEEEKRVDSMTPKELPVRVNLLLKKYGGLTAVNNLSFGMEYGECFALLGVSGAGKTTTFKCLTGEEIPTSGQLHINGYDITNSLEYSEARKMIGYCP